MASNLPPGVTDAMINEQCETNCPHCGGDLEEELSLYLDPLENELAAKDARIAELEGQADGYRETAEEALQELSRLRAAIEAKAREWSTESESPWARARSQAAAELRKLLEKTK